MKIRQKLVILILLLCSSGSFAIPTGDKLVDEIGIQGSLPDEIVIIKLSGWGASGCESARHVVLASTVNNRQEMLSLILSAKMASKPVRFYGDCDSTNSDKFNATYTILK